MNYDQWKLSNPVDDGYGYDMVSNCCGARMDEDQYLCYKCKDHCEPIEDYEYKELQRESYLEMKADAERDER
tara:strand:+ start:253 stop:468 length:216 start_codon:yes stop_codon:yes gene_type:complete